MTHIHYKFSSKLSYDTVLFDGPHTTLRDLKRQIMGREKLRAGDCDLQITNAQSKQEYTDDEGLIPKGSSVIVRRIPVSGGKSSSCNKTNNIESSSVQFHPACGATKAMDDQSSSRSLTLFSEMANLAKADVSEEDKIKVILHQSTYEPMNYNKKFGAVLPANYTCYRCGNAGHHIRNCPTSGQDKNFEAPLRIKKSTGIPRSFMVEVDDPNIKGAMLTTCGRYAIPAIDAEAYAIGKKEKPPFNPQENPKSETKEDPVPDELLCSICHDLLSDAVVIPCCANSYCDDCIRTTLLDSEEHVCPTCGQSDVSPDTLIANKFLRQAVNNFKKERGYTKSLQRRSGDSQTPNPITRPSTVPTPPPVTGQRQPQKPHQPTSRQQVNQDALQHHPKAAETLPLSGGPPAATCPTSADSTPGTSHQPEYSCLDIPKKEAEEKTQDDSEEAAAAPSVQVSDEKPTAAPTQLIPVINHTVVAEQPLTGSRNPQQTSSSLGSTARPCEPPISWDSFCSSSGLPTRGWTESQQLTSSSTSSYSTATPPLFAPPQFLSSHSSYPPGYQQTTPIWAVPSPQGTPIPSLCSSTPTSSIPSLIPNEWYKHQRRKKESSPQRESTYRRSSSSCNSKSSKSKSSRSYSRSSSRSRSRSRSRSQGRSRRHSPYSHHRDAHSRSHQSCSYSYGYKRSHSPKPSSSSSSRGRHCSRSKSPSDHQKKRHHSRHQNKKSSASSNSSRRRGEHAAREKEGSDVGLASSPYAQHTNQTASLELERECYLQWKKQYKDWCEKYFSSYMGHFHQMPLPLLNFPPPPPPPPPSQWVDSEVSQVRSRATPDPRYQPQGGHTACVDRRSPSSQSSTDSRSPLSYSSSDICSTPSQSFSDSRSSPSHTTNDNRSSPSQSSSYGRSTPSEDRALSNACQQKFSDLANRLTKGIKEVEVQERSKDGNDMIITKFETHSTLKHEHSRMKKHDEGSGEESSSPEVADSTGDSRNHQHEAATNNPLKLIQPSLKAKKSPDKECGRDSREQRNMKGWRGAKHSDSRQDADTMDRDGYRNPGGREFDTTLEKKRKGKCEEQERNKSQHGSESLNPFERKKQKNEKQTEIKTEPQTKRDIWEEGMKVKPQKKISININLDGKRKEGKTGNEDLSCSESITGKTKGEIVESGKGQEEPLNRGGTEVEVKQNEEISRKREDEINTGEAKAREIWKKGTFRHNKAEMWGKAALEQQDIGERTYIREEEDFDLWHCALRGMEEEEVGGRSWENVDSMEASKGEGVTPGKSISMTGKEVLEGRIRNESRGQEMMELVRNSPKKWADGRSTCDKNREIPLEESKPKGEEELTEEVKRMIKKEEDVTRSKEPTSRKEHHREDDGEDHQERRQMVKTLKECTQDRAAEREKQHVVVQVPLPKREDEPERKEQHKTEIRDQNSLYEGLPPPLLVPSNQETEGENKQKSQRSVDVQRDRDRAMQGDATLYSSSRAVTPSSGKYWTDSTDRERERKTELERQRDRERGRESERWGDRQKESNKAKEKRKEEERGRYRGSERGHWNHPPSSHFSSSLDRRDWQRGGDQGREKNHFHPSRKPSGSGGRERSSKSTAAEELEKNVHKIRRDASLELNFKDKNPPYDYYNHTGPSLNYRCQNRPAGTYPFPSFLSLSQGNDRDPLPSESFGPGWELMQNRSRNESKEEKGAWKRNKVDGKADGRSRERAGGSRWENEAHKFDRETKREEGRELEEGERPSSRSSNSSSSSIPENSKDERKKGRKKHKKHRKEKRQAGASELLEEKGPKKPKKSMKTAEGREQESGGEVDDREEDRPKLCSLMFS